MSFRFRLLLDAAAALDGGGCGWVRDTADVLGISHQRVQQLLASLAGQ